MELATGATFAGRYQIIEEQGKGGMGRVYKALDKETQERIALKLIKPEIASDKKDDRAIPERTDHRPQDCPQMRSGGSGCERNSSLMFLTARLTHRKYMIRPLLSLERLSFDEKEGKVCYQFGKSPEEVD